MGLTANKPTHSMARLLIVLLTLLAPIQQLLLFRPKSAAMSSNIPNSVDDSGYRVFRDPDLQNVQDLALCRSAAASIARSRSDEQVSARDYPAQPNLQLRLGGK
jgi:hypothetical protein